MINYPDTIKIYDDYFPECEIDAIHSGLNKIPQNWFSERRMGSDYNGTKIWWDINKPIESAPLSQNYRNLTYQFLSTDNHEQGCSCSYCRVIKRLGDKPPPDVGNDYIGESSLTLYRPGDYLGQHEDRRKARTWAFTLTLSKEWRPEWGGILNVEVDMNEWLSFPPKYNRLILMRTDGPTSCNHFVSHVIPEAPAHRLTVSGWFHRPLVQGIAA